MTSLSRRAILASVVAAGAPRPLFAGTFLQPWRRHLSWTPAGWRALFEALRALACREVILQWSGYDDIDYAPLAGALLGLAATYDMKITVGLPYGSSWWSGIDQDQDAALEAVVARARRFAASPPAGQWRSHPAFAGWYLPEEIDDRHWMESRARARLEDGLGEIASRFGPLSVSGFTSRAAPPRALALFWRALARRARLARVCFQDGVGAGKTTLDAWPEYLKALAGALGKRLDIVVEIFQAAPGEGAFRAEPAPLERILEQVRLARAATRRAPLCFSLPDYAAPAPLAPAGALYEQFLAQRGR